MLLQVLEAYGSIVTLKRVTACTGGQNRAKSGYSSQHLLRVYCTFKLLISHFSIQYIELILYEC